MSKGFGKFVLFCAAVGAATAGIFYYLNKNNNEDFDEFDDDFDDFDDDLDIEEDDEAVKTNRKYVNIDAAPATEDEEAVDEADAEEKKDVESEEFFDDDDADEKN